MKGLRKITLWTAILLSCLLIFTFADDISKILQAVESNARVVYNGKEANLGVKPVLISGHNYLPIRALSVLFDKNISWDQKENAIIISDKTNPELENLKSKLTDRDKSIAELQEKVKKLEYDLQSNKRLSIKELQDKINNEYGEYDGVTYRVILSGNEDEIRVKIEVDLSRDKSAWGRLSTADKEEMVNEIYREINSQYGFAKIKGYIKDINVSKKLMSFHYDWEGSFERSSYRNHSTISTLEDSFNDSYGRYFGNIHFTYALNGNDSRMEYTIYIQRDRFEEEWNKLKDSALKNFMKKLCSEISDKFSKCHITGIVYDTDSGSQLAYCEQVPGGTFTFERDQ